jgi:hypothetical protein
VPDVTSQGVLAAVARKNAGGGQVFLINEDAEGTGTPSGWTDSGANVDWDYSTSALSGSESLRITTSENTYYDLGSGYSELWSYFMVNLDDTAVAGYFFEFQTSAGTPLGRIRCLASESVRAYFGSLNTTGGTIAAATTYHIWTQCIESTGSDGEMHVYISTTGTKPGAPTVSRTGGTQTGALQRIQFKGDDISRFDNILISETSIGDQ